MGIKNRILGRSDGVNRGNRLVLRDWLRNNALVLGFKDGDVVGKGLLGSGLSGGIPRKHDLNLQSEDTLAEEDVADSVIDVILRGLTRVNHESVGELHGLGTLGAELSGNDNFTTLGTSIHDEAEDTVASPADGKTSKKLVAEGLALGDGGETTGVDLFSVELNRSLGEVETLLDKGGKLANTASLLSENVLGLGGPDDDLLASGGDTDFNSGVSLLRELTGEELVEFSIENSVGDELMHEK